MFIKYFKYAGLVVLLTSLTLVSVHAQDGGNQGEWTNFTVEDGLPINLDHSTPTIRSIAVAPDNTIWIGTWDGLIHYDGEDWITYTQDNGLASSCISAIDFAPDGSVWVSTTTDYYWSSKNSTCTQGGVSWLDGETWMTYDGRGARNDYLSIIHTSDQDVWVSSFPGIHLYDGTTWQLAKAHLGTSQIALAPDDTIWVTGHAPYCEESWVEHYDGETWTEFTAEDGIIQACIDSVAVAPDGGVWAAFYSAHVAGYTNGLLHYDGQSWTTFTSQDHPALAQAHSLAVGPDGTIWVATHSNGILQFDGETWTQFTTEDGLADDTAVAIAVAPDGTVWVGTLNGVSRYIPPQD